MASGVPAVAQEAVLVQSGKLPVEPIEVKGYDFNKGIDHHKLLQSFRTSGFQATNFGLAVEEINKMVIDAIRVHVSKPAKKLRIVCFRHNPTRFILPSQCPFF